MPTAFADRFARHYRQEPGLNPFTPPIVELLRKTGY
jgi:hypothetical protein